MPDQADFASQPTRDRLFTYSAAPHIRLVRKKDQLFLPSTTLSLHKLSACMIVRIYLPSFSVALFVRAVRSSAMFIPHVVALMCHGTMLVAEIETQSMTALETVFANATVTITRTTGSGVSSFQLKYLHIVMCVLGYLWFLHIQV
jgi:hypothetical protein